VRRNNEKWAIAQRIRSLGGEGILDEQKAIETGIGVLRVLDLMIDGKWHNMHDICTAAGGPNGYASEGLRRMRELRSLGYEVLRDQRGPGTWVYCIRKKPASEPDAPARSNTQRTLPF